MNRRKALSQIFPGHIGQIQTAKQHIESGHFASDSQRTRSGSRRSYFVSNANEQELNEFANRLAFIHHENGCISRKIHR